LLGCDFAGTVDAVGSAVPGWREGQMVLGSLRDPLSGRRGSYGGWVTADPTEVVELPAGVSLELGAALPVSGASALQCLEIAEVNAGDEVLIIGATGGVGSFATALAAARGAYVTAVCRERNEAYARQLGAAKVIAHDCIDPLDAPARYDAILDLAGAHDFSRCAPRLKPQGRYVLSTPGTADYLAAWRSRLIGGPRAYGLAVRRNRAVMTQLAALAAAGAFDRIALSSFTLDEARKALEQSRAGGVRGKILLAPAASLQS